MRAVIDTNVLLSGLLWHGTPHNLLDLARSGTLTLITCPTLLAELADVIQRPKFHTILARLTIDPARLMHDLREVMEVVDPPRLQAPVSRDPDDDAVLALAVAAQADLVISGDADLLALGVYAGVPIVDPSAALARLGPFTTGH